MWVSAYECVCVTEYVLGVWVYWNVDVGACVGSEYVYKHVRV